MDAHHAPSRLLSALRAGTGWLHAELQTACPIQTLVETPEGYAEVLARLLPFYRAMESNLWNAQETWRPAPWADRIERDLETLGYKFQSRRAIEIPAVRTPSARIGRLYVLEGGTLGGHDLARRLWDQHRFHANNGASFYAAPDSGLRWKAFLTYLATLDSVVNLDEAVLSATETFIAFRDYARQFPSPSSTDEANLV